VKRDWTEVAIPFGRHKGKTVEEAPSSYLRWIIEKVDESKYPSLIGAADKELAWRSKWSRHFED